MSKTDEMRKQREAASARATSDLDELDREYRAHAEPANTFPAKVTTEPRGGIPDSLLASNYRSPDVTVTPDPVTKSVTRKGRPPYPEGTARTCYVGFLATPAEVKGWRAQAGSGRSLSAWVRLTLNATVKRV